MKENPKKVIIVGNDEINMKRLKKSLGKYKFIEKISDIDIDDEPDNLNRFCNCDIILFEILNPISKSIKIIKKTMKKFPDINIVAIMNKNWELNILQITKSGVKVVILEQSKNTEIKSAIKAALCNKQYFCEDIMNFLIFNSCNKFTKTEKLVLNLISKGYSNQEIAEELSVTTSDVYTHKHNLHDKTGTKTDVELVNFSIKYYML